MTFLLGIFVALEGSVELKVKLDLENLKANTATAAKSIKDLDQVKANIQIDLAKDRLQSDLAALQGQLKALDRVVISPEIQIKKEELQSDLTKLQAELKALDIQINPQIKLEKDATEIELAALKNDLKLLDIQINPEVKLQKDVAEAELTNLQSELKALDAEVLTPEVQLKKEAVQANIAEVEAQLKTLDSQIYSPEVQLQKEAVQASITEVEAELKTLDAQLYTPEVRLQKDAVEASISQVENELKALEAKPTQVQVELQKDATIEAIATVRNQLKETENLRPKIQVDNSGLLQTSGIIDQLKLGLAQGIGQAAFASLTQLATSAITTAQNFAGLTKEYEKLKRELGFTLGGVEKGADAFKIIEEFALKTGTKVQDLAAAFKSLKFSGIEPTKESLLGLSDFAKAQGKSIGDISDGIYQASVGYYRGLREFGIKAKESGDKVNLVFRGVRVTVDKGAEGIEQAFQKFAKLPSITGATERQAASLDGAYARLQIQVEKTVVAFGTGLSPELKAINRIQAEGVEKIVSFVQSLEGTAAATGKAIGGLLKTATDNQDLIKGTVIATAAGFGTLTLATTASTIANGLYITSVFGKTNSLSAFIAAQVKAAAALGAEALATVAATLASGFQTAALLAQAVVTGDLTVATNILNASLTAGGVASAAFLAGLGAVTVGLALVAKTVQDSRVAQEELDGYAKQIDVLFASSLQSARATDTLTNAIIAQGIATDEQKEKAKQLIAIDEAQIEANKKKIEELKNLNVTDLDKGRRDQEIKDLELGNRLLDGRTAALKEAVKGEKAAVDSLRSLDEAYKKVNSQLEQGQTESITRILQAQLASNKSSVEAAKDAADARLQLEIGFLQKQLDAENAQIIKLKFLAASLANSDDQKKKDEAKKLYEQAEQLEASSYKKREELAGKFLDVRKAAEAEYIQTIQDNASKIKALSDLEIGQYELKISKQTQLNGLVDAQRALTAQQQALAQTATDSIIQGFDNQIKSLDRAKGLTQELNQIRLKDQKDIQADIAKADQLQQQLNSGAITNLQQRRDTEAQISALRQGDGELRKALEAELSRLGIKNNATERDFLISKQQVENSLADAKRNALLTEQKIQKDNLELDLERNKVARQSADIQAQINLLKAQSETLGAKATVAATLDPVAKANAETVVKLREEQEKLAKDGINNQKEINRLQERSDEVSKQLLKTKQTQTLSELDYNDAIRKGNQAIDLGKENQNLKNKAVQSGVQIQGQLTQAINSSTQAIDEQLKKAKEANTQTKEQVKLIEDANNATIRGIYEAAKAKDALRDPSKAFSQSFSAKEGSQDAITAINKTIEAQAKLNSRISGFLPDSKALANQRANLEKAYGVSVGSSSIIGASAPQPLQYTSGKSPIDNSQSQTSNITNNITIQDRQNPERDLRNALVLLGRI